MNVESKPFYSVAQVAAELSVPHARVAYVIKTRGIRPIGRAGTARLFSAEQFERIALAIREIDETEARRCARVPEAAR